MRSVVDRERAVGLLCGASLLACATVLLVEGGCSLVLGVDGECTTDSSCASRGPGLRCVRNLCVLADGDGDADTDVDADVDADEESDADQGPMYPEDLLGGPCTQVVGLPLDDPIPDDAILVGAIHPYTGQLELAGPYFDHATVLAVEEINGVGGLLGRPLALVLCDSGTSAPTAIDSAQHLADLGVQAVLGPFSSSVVIAVFDEVFHERGIVIVSAGANSPVMSTLSSEGLIWSTSLPAARQATAIAEHLLESDATRVAVVNRDDTWGTGMREALQAVYCAERDCTDSTSYITRFYDTSNLVTSLSDVAAGLHAYDPDVTVMLTYVEDALTFLNIVAALPGTPLRSFIWNDAIGDDVAFDRIATTDHPIFCQVMGTTAALPTGTLLNSFLLRYRARWDDEVPVPYTTNYYDATYMLAYAIAAATAGSETFTGRDVGAAMSRLSAGDPIEAGPSQFRQGVQALRASTTATIDYVGASGDLDFVAGTGSVVTPVEAFRLNVERRELESLGVIYDIDGSYSAPDFAGVSDAQCTEVEP